MSAMKIEKNGQASLDKRSRHVNVRYFFVKDRLESNDIKVEHCNTEEMIADFLQNRSKARSLGFLKV